jgi:hypothetical protein
LEELHYLEIDIVWHCSQVSVPLSLKATKLTGVPDKRLLSPEAAVRMKSPFPSRPASRSWSRSNSTTDLSPAFGVALGGVELSD